MPKNYYIILGIPSNSTQTDIKAAYRRLAKEFHPDRYGESQTPFQVLQEAYSVLSDPKSRKAYDDSLQANQKPPSYHPEPKSWRSQNQTRRYFEETIEPLVPEEPQSFTRTSPRSVFDTIFDHIAGEFQDFRQPEKPWVEELTVEISLSPEEARRGGSIQFNIPVRVRCSSCHRYNRRYYNCRRCSGTGFMALEKTISLRYPAGIRNNYSIPFDLSPFNATKIHITALFRIG